MKLRLVAARDWQIDSEDLERTLELIRVRTRDCELLQVQAGGRVLGRMKRVRTPLNEDWQQAMAALRESQQPPEQGAAIGAQPRTLDWTIAV
jgi:hypothetical protein